MRSGPMAKAQAIGKGVSGNLFVFVKRFGAGNGVAINQPANQIAILAPRTAKWGKLGIAGFAA